ncbi:MFS transporter [Nocardia donostiensis]|uniref:MFS transporter n=1 Tax=Nocardia donostiensis TaxID=1538463 RepID=UPI00158D657D|nr:MFS transporter [Nocardia donostiensis]
MRSRGKGSRLSAVGTIFLTVFFAMLDLSVVNVALPTIREELSTAYSGMQWIANSYTLAFAGVLLSGGAIVDRLGRRRAFLLSQSVFTLGAFMCTVSNGLTFLILGRVSQGVGAAILVPCSLAMIVDLFPEARQRAKAVGIWSAINAIALAVGPVVGGALLGWLGWRAVFGINIPAGLLAIVVACLVLLPDHTRARRQIADPAGIILALCASTLVAFAVVEATDRGWRAPTVISTLSAGLVGLVFFALRNLQAKRPVLPHELLRDSVFRTSLLTVLCVGFAYSSALFLLAIQFQASRDYSPIVAGLALAPAAVAMAIASTLLGRVQDKLGARKVMQIGMLAGAVGLVALGLTPPYVDYIALVLPLVFFGAGMGITLPAANNAGLSRVTADNSGVGSAAIESSQQFGLVMGVAILGALQSATTASSHAHIGEVPDIAVLAGGLTALAFGVVLSLGGTRQGRGDVTPVVGSR